jgi:hypothetical protein
MDTYSLGYGRGTPQDGYLPIEEHGIVGDLRLARTLIAMSEQPTTGLSLKDRYADLVDELVPLAGVTPPAGGRGFGRSALKFQGRIFAMLVRGHLVLKLPAGRVAELVEAGDGIPFDANKGTPMREWLSLDADSPRDWLALAGEALEFSRAHG